jgi:hypothetical protein
LGAIFSRVSRLHPVIEIIIVRRGEHAILWLILSGQHGLLACMHRESPIIARDFAIAGSHCDIGLIIFGIRIDTVIARAQYREGQVGSVHLKALLALQLAHPDTETALRQPNLYSAIVQVHKLNGRPGA